MEAIQRSESGPLYRATKLWNEVIHDFCCGMPLKKHRRQIRCYENCFTATEAVDWLHYYLQRNHKFGPHVTRQQTVQLLQKFLKSGVIQNVHKRKSFYHEEFQDNKNLYRFAVLSSNVTPKSPARPLQSTVPGSFTHLYQNMQKDGYKMKQSHTQDIQDGNYVPSLAIGKAKLPECCFVARSLSLAEVEKVWRNVTLSRLSQILDLEELEPVLDVTQVQGKNIVHNMTRISKTGVVNLIDKTDDLPHWVLSAMKCLANWPNASGSGSCLPKYPGFENDVFKVVRDYFCNLDKPLVPYPFYWLFIFSYCGSCKVENQLHDNVHDQNEILNTSCTSDSLATMISLMNLHPSNDQKTSTPVGQINTSKKPEIHLDFLTNKNSEKQQILDTKNKEHLNKETTMNTLPSLYYETAFAFASPVTRVIPHGHIDVNHSITSRAALKTLNAQRAWSLNSASTISACSRVRSPSSLKSGDSGDVYFRDPELRQSTPHIKWTDKDPYNPDTQLPRKAYSENNIAAETFDPAQMASQLHFDKEPSTLPRTKENKMRSSADNISGEPLLSKWVRRASGDYIKNSSADVLSDTSCQESSYHTASVYDSLNESWCTVEEPSTHDRVSTCHSDLTISSLNAAHLYSGSGSYLSQYSQRCETSSVGVQTSLTDLHSLDDCSQDPLHTDQPNLPRKITANRKVDGLKKSNIIERLQLSSLLIPPQNRRALHLLLRLMNKMQQNPHLNINQEISMKALLQQTFVRSIIRAFQETDYDETCAQQIVTFLIDHCESVLEPPAYLKQEVEDVISTMQRSRIKYTVDDACMLTYCEQVTLQRYEDQKHALLQTALSELLESIIYDTSITEKERKRKLKQFKENHPEIYQKHFPNDKHEKSPHLNRKWSKNFLTRIKTIRL